MEVSQRRKKALESSLKQTNKQYLSKLRIQNLQLLLGHPAQYSGEKQGDSTDDVYGSKSEKKESTRTSVETNKQTKSIRQSREILQNLQLLMRHPAQYSGMKQGDSTKDVYREERKRYNLY